VRRLAALVIGCLLAAGLAAQSLQVIDLKYRTAAEVIPVLQPLLEPGGALTGQDYKLFVRASSANVAQLRKALAEIDRQPRQFLVAVRRATRQQIEREQASVSGVIGSSGANVTLSTGDSTQHRESSGVASVNVIEGNAAFIASGESVPVVTSVVIGGGKRPRVGMSNSYRDLSSGFTVTPRLAGEQVVLTIEQQAEHRAADGSGIQTQRLSTQVGGKLGEWLPLGGVSESARNQSTGIASGRLATRSDETQVWVRVTASL
jgi:type II secretory pathway component GspD/PulD (secretin)